MLRRVVFSLRANEKEFTALIIGVKVMMEAVIYVRFQVLTAESTNFRVLGMWRRVVTL
jgi:hypothetical protein